MPSLVNAIAPSVKAVPKQVGNALDNAIRQNVIDTIAKLKSTAPIFDVAVQQQKLKVVGGIYRLRDGKVEMVDLCACVDRAVFAGIAYLARTSASTTKFRIRIVDAVNCLNTPSPGAAPKLRQLARLRRSEGREHMSGGGTLTFGDPDRYAAGFDGVRLNLTITGAGDFEARLTRLKLQHLEVYGCRERLPRIAYISLPLETVFVSFALGTAPPVFDGFALRTGNMVLHGCGEHVHQRSEGECHWALISLSPDQLASSSKALTGNSIALPPASRIVCPSRRDSFRFQGLFKQACHLAETRNELIERIEIARALEQQILHAIVHCLTANDADDNSKTRHHHAAVMSRFEEVLSTRIDQRLTMPELCVQVGVPERTLRMCCAEFVGVSPMRYLLLQRLNKARSALRHADPSSASVAAVARNHQFLELGRFAVKYRATFGESPSTTLHRCPQA